MDIEVDRALGLVIIVVAVCIGAVFGLLVGDLWIAQSEWEVKTVEAGHAEFFIDEDHGREWRWVEGEHVEE